MSLPQISVITVVYNGARWIERTMQSVASQRNVVLEHIIMDGASTDGTAAIATQGANDFVRFFSEPDKGIYDAMNKALTKATGDFVIFMNAGDEFYDEQTLQRALQSGEGADFIYGNTAVVDAEGRLMGDRRLSPPAKLNWRSMQYGMCVSHQSMIVRRSLVEPFDLHYRISADIDWTIRMLQKASKIHYANGYIAKFLEGGVSSTRRREGLKERFQIMCKYYGAVRTLFNHFVIAVRFVWHRLTRRSMT